MRPILVIIESSPVREVRVGPPCRHLLLVVDEELPCILREVRLPDGPLRGRRVVYRPGPPQVILHAPAPVENHSLSIRGLQPHSGLVQSDDLVIHPFSDNYRTPLSCKVYCDLDRGRGAIRGPSPRVVPGYDVCVESATGVSLVSAAGPRGRSHLGRLVDHPVSVAHGSRHRSQHQYY